MLHSYDDFPRLTPVGDSALLIELGDALDPGLNFWQVFIVIIYGLGIKA